MSKSDGVTGRFFLVGCPRSGTTLLQTMLARHTAVFSLPETHFFRRIFGRPWLHRVPGVTTPRTGYRALGVLLRILDRKDLRRAIPLYRVSCRSYGRAFSSLLDRVTLEQGKSVWLEKTPPHLHFIPQIQGAVPESRFIHIIRDGRAVVASFYELCLQNPQMWVPQVLPGKWRLHIEKEPQDQRILDAVIDRWNLDLDISLQWQGHNRHKLVLYEDLLDNPEGQLASLCEFMSIPFEPAMLSHWEAAEAVVGWRSSYSWMQKPFEQLQDTGLQKFTKVFTLEEQSYVEQRLRYGGRVADAWPAPSPEANAGNGIGQRASHGNSSPKSGSEIRG
jgi:hypothetical protein